MIKAYTILEIIVVMLISAILIGITYNAYDIISQSYKVFTKKNEDMARISLLDKVLKRDILFAHRISPLSDGITLYGEDTVTYHFYKDFLTRTKQSTDTLKIINNTLNLTFEGRPISNDYNNVLKEPMVDDITFSLSYDNQEWICHYHKTYSSKDLYNPILHAIN